MCRNAHFIAEHNTTEANPFVWRADPDDIILVSRAASDLNSLQQVADLLRAESLGTA